MIKGNENHFLEKKRMQDNFLNSDYYIEVSDYVEASHLSLFIIQAEI